MKVRHEYLKGETVTTSMGLLILDDKGLVTNLKKLKIDGQQLIDTLPGFINGDLYGDPIESSEDPESQAEAAEEEPENPALAEGEESELVPEIEKVDLDPNQDGVEAADKAIYETITRLTEAGATMNSEGYIAMPELNEELKKIGMEAITGARRKQVTDKFRALEASQQPE